MKKNIIISLLIIIILSITGTQIYMSLNCNIWGLNNFTHIELLKTENVKTLNNVQNLLLDNFNIMIITRDGSDYHIYLKKPQPCDVNKAIISIANSKVFDKSIRFSPVVDIGNVLKDNYTENLTKRLENLFLIIDGVVNAKVTITDMFEILTCQKCDIEVNVKIAVNKNFNRSDELKNIVKNILFGLDLGIKEENINIEILR